MLAGLFIDPDGLPAVRGEIAHQRTGQMAGVVFLLDPASPTTVISAHDLARIGQRLVQVGRHNRLFFPGASVPVGEVSVLIGFRHEPFRLAVYHTNVAIVPGSTTRPDFVSRLGWDILSRWRVDLDPVENAIRCDVREADFAMDLPGG